MPEKTEENNNKEHKRSTPRSYFSSWDHKQVIIYLVKNKLIGKLHTNLYNKFFCELELKGGHRILISKGSILYITELDTEL